MKGTAARWPRYFDYPITYGAERIGRRSCLRPAGEVGPPLGPTPVHWHTTAGRSKAYRDVRVTALMCGLRSGSTPAEGWRAPAPGCPAPSSCAAWRSEWGSVPAAGISRPSQRMLRQRWSAGLHDTCGIARLPSTAPVCPPVRSSWSIFPRGWALRPRPRATEGKWVPAQTWTQRRSLARLKPTAHEEQSETFSGVTLDLARSCASICIERNAEENADEDREARALSSRPSLQSPRCRKASASDGPGGYGCRLRGLAPRDRPLAGL